MSETKRYRKFTAAQKTEIVLASLRGNKTHAQLCREHDLADSLLRKWREQFLAAGTPTLAGRQRRPLDHVDRKVLDVARENPTDGSRMVACLAARELGQAVNRKRAQRLMREHRLLQPKRTEGRRKRPGYFEVTRPDELWHLDMTSIWVAEHGWCYLNAAIDCCTREITAWSIDVRCRAAEAIAVVDAAVAKRAIRPLPQQADVPSSVFVSRSNPPVNGVPNEPSAFCGL